MFIREKELYNKLDSKTHEIIHILEAKKDSLLKELSGVDKLTLTKLRDLMDDFYNAEHQLSEYVAKSNLEFDKIKAEHNAEMENEKTAFGEALSEIKADFEKQLIQYAESYLMEDYAREVIERIAIETHPYDVVQSIGNSKTQVMSQNAIHEHMKNAVLFDYTGKLWFMAIKNADSGGVGSVASLERYTSKHKHIGIDCVEGDVFEIRGKCDSDTVRRLYSFLDANNVVLECTTSMDADNEFTDIRMIKAPAGAVKLYCNFLEDENTLLRHVVAWKHSTKDATEKAERAVEIAETAKTEARKIAEDAKTKSETATTTAEQAKEIAFEAKATAEEAKNIAVQGYHYNYIPEFKAGYMANSGSGGVGSTAPLTVHTSPHSYIVVECSGGDIFEICGRCNRDTVRRLYSFLDANNVVLMCPPSVDADNIITDPTMIVAPENAVKLVCNMVLDENSMLIKGTEWFNDVLYAVTTAEKAKATAENAEHYVKDGIQHDYIPEFISGAIRNADNGGIGSTALLTTYSSPHSHIIIPCSGGDFFEIRGTCTRDTVRRLYSFLDANNVVLSCAGVVAENTITTPTVFEAPEGTAKLVCNMLLDENSMLRQLAGWKFKVDEAHKNATEAREIAENISKAGSFDTTTQKYIFPKWAELHPFEVKDTGFTNSMLIAPFANWYSLFESLYQAHSDQIEKTDIGALYNSAKGETTPSYISSINNGAIYMYHLKNRVVDGNVASTEHQHHKLKLLITSGIHGGEKQSIYDNYLLMKELLEGSTNRAIINLRNFVDLYFVPMVNVSGIEANTYPNANNININRDFAVENWRAYSGSSTVPNSQWETRVLSYLIDTLAPDAYLDHHSAGGDSTVETTGKIIQWGYSSIPSMVSLIEENVAEMTGHLVNLYPEKLGHYTHLFGHGQHTTQFIGYAEVYAHEKGCISSIIETFQHLKWDTDEGWIFGFDDESEKQIVSISYFTYINYLMKFVNEAVRFKNENIIY